MKNYRDSLDEIFVSKLGYEFRGLPLPVPEIDGRANLTALSKEYSANGVDVILAECKDRIPEFQKKLIQHFKNQFPDSHFLFISNEGSVFDLFNVSSSNKLKKITYNEIDKNTRLFKEKIELFNVEAADGTVDLKIKIDRAFDTSEKITRKFYDKFQTIHKKLQKAISGIDNSDDKEWYASVLMNRLMFIYFLQKHGVIQNDYNFLLSKYNQVVQNGRDYYRDFLLPLFFYGFAKRDGHTLKQAFVKEYGHVKYLNGGLFYPHRIETKHTPSPVSENIRKGYDDPVWILERIEIRVDGKALKDILEFLNGYTWYLDNRPMREDTDINPDVLGYIFEKYINQKELGAYYTKEDITGYISKNTIIPFILDKLRHNGFDAPDPKPMITNNEDIIGNMADYLEQLQDYDTLKFLYKDVLMPLSVLDPSVGSGAFLFAALNILLPIYQKVVFKLRAFHNSDRVPNPVRVNGIDDGWLKNLCDTLDGHSEEYYLTKQIILNNLYGVDIVEEATEICKLRLFLQLVSHLPNREEIEPLPDIDFNIYAGNSLVGGLSWHDLEANYTMDLFTAANREAIKKDIEKLSELKSEYKQKISEQIQQLAQLKEEYRQAQQLEADEEELNRLKGQIDFLEKEINANINIGIDNPFHWFIQFNQIMERGGFDVIIGNPPYVEYSKVKNQYILQGLETIKTANLYSFFVERSEKLLNNDGRLSLITQASICSTRRMESIQEYFINKFSPSYFSTFAVRPSKLFDGAEIRTAILLGRKSKRSTEILTTKYNRWYAEERSELFKRFKYVKLKRRTYPGTIAKIGNDLENRMLCTLLANERMAKVSFDRRSEYKVYYHNTPRYFIRATDFIPYFYNQKDGEKISTQVRALPVKKRYFNLVLSLINSSLFYWWFIINSDCFHLNVREIENFPIGKPPSATINSELSKLVLKLMASYKENAFRKQTFYKTTGNVIYDEFRPKLSKPIVNEIDKVLFEHYGFDKEICEFISGYDLKYRMGRSE